jgi:hypothetical protein
MFGIFPPLGVCGDSVEIPMDGKAQLHESLGQHTVEMVFGFMAHIHAEQAGLLRNGLHIVRGQSGQNVS